MLYLLFVFVPDLFFASSIVSKRAFYSSALITEVVFDSLDSQSFKRFIKFFFMNAVIFSRDKNAVIIFDVGLLNVGSLPSPIL
ncbi:hypothetical protein BpHYR1_022689, partial [Brachionus plicatilis]